MTIKKVVCDECSQTAFADVLKEWDDMHVCSPCWDRMFNNKYNWGNKRLAIQMELGSSSHDYDEVVVPLFDNLDDNNIYDDVPILDAFNQLKEKWEGAKWGYYGDVKNMRLIEADLGYSKVDKCSEFDIWMFEELAVESDLYDRPFDLNPNSDKFVSWFARKCMIGNVYSKDFMYYYCYSCNRHVCGQNPSNGWMSQVHIGDGYVECNKCYEERVLRDGINDDFDGDNIPGQFFNYSDVEEAGWEEVETGLLAGSGRRGYADPSSVTGKIQKLIDEGWRVLVNYEDMAIGGLGGYVSLYKKNLNN